MIGINASVKSKEITIESDSIIGAQSIVLNYIEPKSVVAGNLGEIIKVVIKFFYCNS